jgi:hypothetical protein
MKKTIGLLISLVSVSAMANPAGIVKKLAAEQLKEDIKTEIKLVKEGICGADGPSYIVTVKVKKLKKSLNEKTGAVELVDSWKTIKTYGATAAEMNGPITPGLMDSEGCIE